MPNFHDEYHDWDNRADWALLLLPLLLGVPAILIGAAISMLFF